MTETFELQSPRVICAWCGVELRAGTGSAVSHGMCANCLGAFFNYPVNDVSALSAEEIDHLPYGGIRLDCRGNIVQYNDAEASIAGRDPAKVLGKNFFREVAPCTAVKEFEGEFIKLQGSSVKATKTLTFIFKFATRSTAVKILLAFDPADSITTVVVRKVL